MLQSTIYKYTIYNTYSSHFCNQLITFNIMSSKLHPCCSMYWDFLPLKVEYCPIAYMYYIMLVHLFTDECLGCLTL